MACMEQGPFLVNAIMASVSLYSDHRFECEAMRIIEYWAACSANLIRSGNLADEAPK